MVLDGPILWFDAWQHLLGGDGPSRQEGNKEDRESKLSTEIGHRSNPFGVWLPGPLRFPRAYAACGPLSNEVTAKYRWVVRVAGLGRITCYSSKWPHSAFKFQLPTDSSHIVGKPE